MHGADVSVLGRLTLGVEAGGDPPHGIEQVGPGSRSLHLRKRDRSGFGRAGRRELAASNHGEREEVQLHR